MKLKIKFRTLLLAAALALPAIGTAAPAPQPATTLPASQPFLPATQPIGAQAASSPAPKPAQRARTTASASSSRTLAFSPFFGFGYRRLAVGAELESYVDETRNKFKDSMPGFPEFLQLGHQLPYFTVGLGVQPKRWHLLPRDSLELLVSMDFSTSAIFGESTDQKTFDASVQGIPLGATPTTWTQHLNHYLAGGLGVKYSPVELGRKIKLKPLVGLSAGISHVKSTSVLHIHVNGNDVTEGLGWETLNRFDVYQDINTVADCSGTGYFVNPMVGVSVSLGDFSLEALAGYRLDKIPSFTINETTVSDGRVEIKSNTREYDASGFDARVTLKYEF